jgi:hypothetical protein
VGAVKKAKISPGPYSQWEMIKGTSKSKLLPAYGNHRVQESSSCAQVGQPTAAGTMTGQSREITVIAQSLMAMMAK